MQLLLTDKEYDLARAYIKKELIGVALSDFESKLKNNEALQEEVIFQKSILSALRLDMVEEAMSKAKIDNVLEHKTEHPQYEFVRNNMQQARMENARSQRRIRRWVVTGLAAACILLVGIFGLRMNSNPILNNEIANLQVVFAPPEPEFEYVKGVDIPTEVQDKLDDAKNQYKDNDFDAALNTLNEIPVKDMKDYILLAKGTIYAKQGNNKESVEPLSKAAQSEDIVIKDEAHYILGLVYLRMENKTKAEKQFNKLSGENEKYRDEADRLLNKY